MTLPYESKPSEPKAKPQKPPTIASILLQVALLGYALYTLSGWAGLGVLTRGAMIVLALLTAVGVTLGIVQRVGHAVAGQLGIDDPSDPEASGRAADASEAALFSPDDAEYRAATPADWRGLDAAFYERSTAELRGLGFDAVGDVVNVKVERSTRWARTVLRALLHRDGTTFGAVYHVRFGGPMRLLCWVGVLPRRMKIFDVESELSDGTFVVVGNTAGMNLTLDTPGIVRETLPPTTPYATVRAAHRALLATTLAARPGVTAVALRSLDEVLAATNRQDALRSAFRNSDAHDLAAEHERIAGRPLREDEREMIEAQRLARANRMRPTDESPPT